MANDELQKLAEELAGLDRGAESARAAALEERIAEFEISRLKKINGKAFFPLLKQSNGKIPYEDFWDIFISVLYKLLREYNPEKATFTTALSFLLSKRMSDYYKKLSKEGWTGSIDWPEEDGGTVEISALVEFPIDDWDNLPSNVNAEEFSKEILLFVRLAPLVAEQKKADKHVTKKMWFERFFTFDVTKVVKDDSVCAKDAVLVNDKIFPLMEILLLKYLLEDTEVGFTHMRDVADAALRDVKLLDKRNEVICRCYNVSKPTVCKRNDAYFKTFTQAVYS
jgi:hypothetical protein